MAVQIGPGVTARPRDEQTKGLAVGDLICGPIPGLPSLLSPRYVFLKGFYELFSLTGLDLYSKGPCNVSILLSENVLNADPYPLGNQ